MVQPTPDIPDDLLAHMRYPEDLFKVQRDMLADYHVTDPKTFYEGNGQVGRPRGPGGRRPQAAALPALGDHHAPARQPGVLADLGLRADEAAEPAPRSWPSAPTRPTRRRYGKFQILRLPDNTQVPGPSQIANQFNSDDAIATRLRSFTQSNARVRYGNLLTLPVGGGLLYVQPLYTLRSGGAASYPQLEFVLVSFGQDVGIGSTLNEALDDVLGTTTTPATAGTDTGSGGTETGTGVSADALKLLQQANDKFAAADQALKDGDLSAYAKNVDEAQALVDRAIALSDKPAPKKSGN